MNLVQRVLSPTTITPEIRDNDAFLEPRVLFTHVYPWLRALYILYIQVSDSDRKKILLSRIGLESRLVGYFQGTEADLNL